MEKKRIGIIGASGYTGGELMRLLAGHGSLELAWATSRTYAGQAVAEAFPYLEGFCDAIFAEPDLETIPEGVEAVLTALPHTEAVEAVGIMKDRGIKVVDLSADFRLDDPALYERWYGAAHGRPDLLSGAVYGLTEWNREAVAGAAVVANPGCYPTAALLALLPLVGAGLVEEGGVVIDAKSGVSGAGRSLKQGSLFCEVNEGLTPYLAGRHRHIPEIRQELEKAAGGSFAVTFTPHLLPLSRGLIETIYVNPAAGATLQDVGAAYTGAYGREPFVRVAPPGKLPSLRETAGTNLCRIGFTDDPEGGRLILVSAIDNLVKGAAGQALQNLNVMLGIDETQGLAGPGLYP